MFLKHQLIIEQIILKDLIGLPGDEIQFKNGEFLLITKKLPRKKLEKISEPIRCGNYILENRNFL